jgi:hypothetical protein
VTTRLPPTASRQTGLAQRSAIVTAKANKRVQVGYSTNYLIDVKHTVIAGIVATPARAYDEAAATRMLECSRRCFTPSSKRIAADTSHGTRKFLAFVTGSSVIPHIPFPRADDRRILSHLMIVQQISPHHCSHRHFANLDM